ncbi:MAG: PTS sugar transporter subunit IIC [Clostridia bacterium]|nr:PTS sugar transporter subunit IIC [Clostridia bacterium]
MTENNREEKEVNQKGNSEVVEDSKKSGFFVKVKAVCKRFFIDAFSGMAQGLFCTLIAGTILQLFAKWIGVDNFVGGTLNSIGNFAKTLMGAGIGVGIAHALKTDKLTMFSAGVAGMVGAFSDKLLYGSFMGGMFPSVTSPITAITLGAPGNPIGAYVVTMLAVEIVKLFAGKTKLDIILIPIGALLLCFFGIFLASPFIWAVDQLGNLISVATDVAPFFMGVIISVVMGVLLTMPTSSAAIWIAVASGITTDSMLLAGGAAVVGCSCHMIGFAVASFRENGVSGLISQGLGTSMLQIPNIMKKPVIMLPEIIASAILGPISTCLFGLKCTASGGGMGTSGLVGVFGTIEASASLNPVVTAIGVALLLFILPAVISFVISEIFRKIGWIKFGDQKLEK